MKRLWLAIIHPVTVIVLLGLAGSACVVAGIFLLFGLGWALVSSGAFIFSFCALVSKGLNNG